MPTAAIRAVTQEGASIVATSLDGEWIFYQMLTPPLFIYPPARRQRCQRRCRGRRPIGMFAPTRRGLCSSRIPLPVSRRWS
jgi:hypothetical protein